MVEVRGPEVTRLLPPDSVLYVFKRFLQPVPEKHDKRTYSTLNMRKPTCTRACTYFDLTTASLLPMSSTTALVLSKKALPKEVTCSRTLARLSSKPPSCASVRACVAGGTGMDELRPIK